MIFKIYIEGGGDGNTLPTECRKGFRLYFEKAGLEGRMPSLIASGSRNNAFNDFEAAVKTAKRQKQKGKQKYVPLLLVDSEGAVSDSKERWAPKLLLLSLIWFWGEIALACAVCQNSLEIDSKSILNVRGEIADQIDHGSILHQRDAYPLLAFTHRDHLPRSSIHCTIII